MNGNIVNSEKSWLEHNRYYRDLDESRLTSIFYFSLIWNIFEKTCCGGNAQINEHAPALANEYASACIHSLQEVWNHFQGRYVEDGATTDIFKSFEFKGNDKKQEVAEILKNNDSASPEKKLEALLRIAFRLRNNLFHGKKEVRRLYDQNENFRQINRLLMILIDMNDRNHSAL